MRQLEVRFLTRKNVYVFLYKENCLSLLLEALACRPIRRRETVDKNLKGTPFIVVYHSFNRTILLKTWLKEVSKIREI